MVRVRDTKRHRIVKVRTKPRPKAVTKHNPGLLKTVMQDGEDFYGFFQRHYLKVFCVKTLVVTAVAVIAFCLWNMPR